MANKIDLQLSLTGHDSFVFDDLAGKQARQLKARKFHRRTQRSGAVTNEDQATANRHK
jgi:hypothetical protein